MNTSAKHNRSDMAAYGRLVGLVLADRLLAMTRPGAVIIDNCATVTYGQHSTTHDAAPSKTGIEIR